jgi:hypothetical protein
MQHQLKVIGRSKIPYDEEEMEKERELRQFISVIHEL